MFSDDLFMFCDVLCKKMHLKSADISICSYPDRGTSRSLIVSMSDVIAPPPPLIQQVDKVLTYDFIIPFLFGLSDNLIQFIVATIFIIIFLPKVSISTTMLYRFLPDLLRNVTQFDCDGMKTTTC